MGIESMIARNCSSVAVYWGNPVNDGEGGFTFDDPVEIACRWEETIQVTTDNKGNEVTSRAVIYITQDVDEEGMLYLGTLDNLDSGQEEDPKTIQGAWIIKRFVKTPALNSSTAFLRKAYLTPSLSFGGF